MHIMMVCIPCRVLRKSLRLRMGHFMPLSLLKVGACFWMATLVRWMNVLVMSSRFMLKRQLVKRAKPLLQEIRSAGMQIMRVNGHGSADVY